MFSLTISMLCLKTPTTHAEEEAEKSTGEPPKEENQALQLPEGDAADSAAEFTLVPSLGEVGFCPSLPFLF
jgi:hypothetical protein